MVAFAARTRTAAGALYASGSSENHESAMNCLVPEGHITSDPPSVSLPRTASAANRPIAPMDSPHFAAADIFHSELNHTYRHSPMNNTAETLCSAGAYFSVALKFIAGGSSRRFVKGRGREQLSVIAGYGYEPFAQDARQ